MKFIHPNIRIYTLGALFAILIGCIFLVAVEKVDGHLFVNSLHSPIFDFFFTYYTHLGGGTFVVIGSAVLAVLFWKQYRWGIVLLSFLNLLLVGASTQFLKQIIFADALRPIRFIGRELLHIAPDVEIHTYNSFPSGHTAAGFAFFALVSFLFGKLKWMQVLCVIFAVLVGYSRIYLSQHFLEDTVLGGAIGLGCFLLSYALVRSFRLGKSLSE